MGVHLLDGVYCVGNVCGVRGVGSYGVHLLEGVYCVTNMLTARGVG
jgi:predicted oxidoreductase